MAKIFASDEQLIREAVEQGRIWALLETVVPLRCQPTAGRRLLIGCASDEQSARPMGGRA
jgi:hypothetical protein